MTNGEKVLEELNTFPLNETGGQMPEGDELPFESPDDFSTDPVSFEEVAAMVRDRVEYFFSLSRICNRHSLKYLDVCAYLERGIRYLGGCCRVVELLKKNDYEFPLLPDLSTQKLFGMVSFNLRKLNAAINEKIRNSREIPEKWIAMHFRYVQVSERLRSTETKISEDLRSSGEGLRRLMARGLTFDREKYGKTSGFRQIPDPGFRSAPAYPMLNVSEIEPGTGLRRKAGSRKADAGKQSKAARPFSREDFTDPSREGWILQSEEDETVISLKEPEAGNRNLYSGISAGNGPAGCSPSCGTVTGASGNIGPAFGGDTTPDDFGEIIPEEGTGAVIIRLPEPLCGQMPEGPECGDRDIGTEEAPPPEEAVDPVLEEEVRYILSFHPEGWNEIIYHMQDPCYLQERPEYVKVFRKLLRERYPDVWN